MQVGFEIYAFVGIGGGTGKLGNNSKAGFSLETGAGLDFCYKNHFVIGAMTKYTILTSVANYSSFGVNLGWRF
ncbi:MAG: hypothetical protein II811_00745 [Spirochaetaceae bacterium]|nr:hypothetical protein [Spirochaetaceae bacterium]